jgi:prepilin-type N-terminal cleavage/methylation domain-containing protein
MFLPGVLAVKNKKQGFTVAETLVTMAIISIIAVACLSVLSASLNAKSRSDALIKEHIALRQAVLIVTSEIRKNPEYFANIDNIADICVKRDGFIWLKIKNKDDIAVAEDINKLTIETEGTGNNKKAVITIVSENGQEVTTKIHLRVNIF